MNRVPLGLAAIFAVLAGFGEPAGAIPIFSGSLPGVRLQASVLTPARYYRRHWHRSYRARYRYRRHRYSPATGDTAPSEASGGIKPGRWEFVAQLQTPAKPQWPAGTQLPFGAEPQSGGGIKTSYLYCITADRAVPAEFGPQCKLDSADRNGSTITWSMTCTNSAGTVRSDGVARYAGDTMDGTMISHLPAAGGKVSDMTQHIAGRYLGPCAQGSD